MYIIHIEILFHRRPWEKKRNLLQLLPGTIYWHHLCNYYPPKDFILFFQFNCAMCVDRLNGPTRIYTATRFGREIITRWADMQMLVESICGRITFIPFYHLSQFERIMLCLKGALLFSSPMWKIVCPRFLFRNTILDILQTTILRNWSFTESELYFQLHRKKILYRCSWNWVTKFIMFTLSSEKSAIKHF